MKRLTLFVLGLILFRLSPICAASLFSHPRGLITAQELPGIRAKLVSEPFSGYLQTLILKVGEQARPPFDSIQDGGELARLYASLFILTDDKVYAEKAWDLAETVLNDQETFNNPLSRGLNRATLLRDMAITYDFCYNAWPEERCRFASEKLFQVMLNTSSNMGYDANYSLASNWMGIRYSTVLLTALIGDDFKATNPKMSCFVPFEWDAGKRLSDHIKTNFNTNGWNCESLSYFAYNWSFVAPSLVAWQNKLGNHKFSIEKKFPETTHAMWAFSTASVSTGLQKVILNQPDFSDDDPMGSASLFPYSLALFPESQRNTLNWMLYYLGGENLERLTPAHLFHSLLWLTDSMERVNPSEAGWLQYYDPQQGIVLFRNQFKDENDIVAGFTATSRRDGHQSYDNLGFRILGLGSIWAVGAGRTGETAGQTSLFPVRDLSDHKGVHGIRGKISNIQFHPVNGGIAEATGSCMGVENHRRWFSAYYPEKTGIDAVFIVRDSSSNGKLWRMHTPGFNTVVTDKNSFAIFAPNGAVMKGFVFSDVQDNEISTSPVRYGGATRRLNYGIYYKENYYENGTAIDCSTEGNIIVVMILQKKVEESLKVTILPGGIIQIGKNVYQ